MNDWADEHWIAFTIAGAIVLGVFAGVLLESRAGWGVCLSWLAVRGTVEYVRHR